MSHLTRLLSLSFFLALFACMFAGQTASAQLIGNPVPIVNRPYRFGHVVGNTIRRQAHNPPVFQPVIAVQQPIYRRPAPQNRVLRPAINRGRW